VAYALTHLHLDATICQTRFKKKVSLIFVLRLMGVHEEKYHGCMGGLQFVSVQPTVANNIGKVARNLQYIP
jgi:hypothetical protein